MEELIREIYKEILNDFKERDYVLADTRIKTVSLYDHLILTSGIAVAIVKELLLREKKPEEICREKISEKELTSVIRTASLLHDWGKDPEKAKVPTEKAYVNHRERSVEWTEEWLKNKGVENTYFNLILSAIERHQLDYNPRTLMERIVCLADSLASAGDRRELAKANTIADLTKISESSYNLYQGVFEGEDGLVLILGDVDKVKSYVYETTKLPEIRGASEILNGLNYEEIEMIFDDKLSKECLIYNGGGSFLALSPKRLADDLIREIQNKYLTKTKTVTITCASNPLPFFSFSHGLMPYDNESIRRLEGTGIGEWLLASHFGKFTTPNKDEWFQQMTIDGNEIEICKSKGFGETVSKLSAELRREKDRKEYAPFFEAIPIGIRCKSCGKRASIDVIKRDGKEEFICEVCNIKRERGGPRGRFKFLEKFEEWIKEKKNKELKLHPKLPQDLDELVLSDRYMAFIYADGNDIGLLLNKAKSPAHYRHIAEGLRVGTKDSLFGALFETFIEDEKLNKFEKLPFEIINIGGDDISVIIAAPFVFDFSKKFMGYFEENLKKLGGELGEKITISLGVVICRSKYPVYFAGKIADSLLKEAKSKWKKLPKDEKESTLSYLYLTSSIATESGEEIIDAVYKVNRKNKNIFLTMRPYTLSEFKFVVEKTTDLKNIFKATQRNALMKVLAKGKLQSINFLFYQIARMDNEKRKKAMQLLKSVNSQFKCEEGGWARVNGELRTPLVDLLEIVKIEGDTNAPA